MRLPLLALALFALCGLSAVALVAPARAQTPLGSAFTYQGLLQQGGQPFSGTADLRFDLYDAATEGTLLGTVLLPALTVTGGVFTVALNAADEFGVGVFGGQQRWLEISVNGTALSPRQELTSTPYSAFSARPWVTGGSDISYSVGRVGIGTSAPAAALDVVGGLSTDAFKLSNGAGLGLVLTSDADGNGVWQTVSGFALPYTGSVGADLNAAFSVINSDATSLSYAGFFTSKSSGGYALVGYADSTSGATKGVVGQSDSTGGVGVNGVATATSGTNFGVYGQTSSAAGWAGYFDGRGRFTGKVGIGDANPPGGSDNPANPFAQFVTYSSTGPGGLFESNRNYGVAGLSGYSGLFAIGVYGIGTRGDVLNYGVIGITSSSALGYGVYSAGRFAATGTKSFQIDHPLDPENQYLNHYCAEGPEPLNVYSGNVTTDSNGEAIVVLPAYFQEVNRDFRYQLTVVDDTDSAETVTAKVARKISHNRFKVRTSKPNIQVSWEVKGVRNDRFVRAYGAPVEEQKPLEAKGKYLQPELYGVGPERRQFFNAPAGSKGQEEQGHSETAIQGHSGKLPNGQIAK